MVLPDFFPHETFFRPVSAYIFYYIAVFSLIIEMVLICLKNVSIDYINVSDLLLVLGGCEVNLERV